MGSFKMFGKERVVEAIRKIYWYVTIVLHFIDYLACSEASLEWETFEQFSVWQLLAAEAPPVEELLKILPLDSSCKHLT